MPSLTALRHRELILVLYDLDYRYERNGEEVCEGHGFSFAECWAIPCCHWNDGECWSSVGQDQCQGKKNYIVLKNCKNASSCQLCLWGIWKHW